MYAQALLRENKYLW